MVLRWRIAKPMMLERSQNWVFLRACTTKSSPLETSSGPGAALAAAESALSCMSCPEHGACPRCWSCKMPDCETCLRSVS